MIQDDRLLDVKITARRIQMKPGTLYNLISKGDCPIPFIKRGRKVLFSNNDINKYIHGLRKVYPKSEAAI